MRSGKGVVDLQSSKEFMCKSFKFNPSFQSDNNVKVQVALHMSSAPIYEAAVNWAELVTKDGFTACFETSGPSEFARNITIQWLAYNAVPNRGLEGTENIPYWTTGTQCETVTFLNRVRLS